MDRRSDACLFCLKGEGPFASREHVVPESLGNKTTLLPKGVVCDRCNTGPLSVCDDALVGFPAFGLLKTMRGITNKRDRLPRAVFGSTEFHARRDGTDNVIYASIPDETTIVHRERAFDIELVAPWSTKQQQRVSRALLKIGIEMLAIDNGKRYVMDRSFDGLRRAVLLGDYPGFLVYNKSNDASAMEITLRYSPFPIGGTGRMGLLVGISVFGVRLSTAWPGLGGPDSPTTPAQGADDLQVVLFPREPPAKDSETLTIRATVSYGSMSEAWDGDNPLVAATIAEFERR